MTTSATIVKRCQKCGKDLSGARRLKDPQGHYWCTDCGAGNSRTSDSSLISPCVKCGTPVHAAHLVRHNGQYVCENCAAGVKSKGGKALADEAAQRKKILLAVGLLVAGGVVYVLTNFVFV